MKKVSVVIPVYNGRNYLRYALESVAAQDYPNIETIVCNSLDSTEDISDIVSEFDATLIQGGHGARDNWQAALDAATGDYVKLLCHDDEITFDCISSQVSLLDADERLSLVFCSRMGINEKGESMGVAILQQEARRIRGRDMICLLFKAGNIIGESATTLTRNVHTQIPKDMNWLFDMYLYIDSLLKGDCYYQPEIMAIIRKHDAQDTHRCLADKDWSAKETADKEMLRDLALSA